MRLLSHLLHILPVDVSKAEVSDEPKAAPDTVLKIFSMTKGIGSTAAMMLIEQGKMNFNTPVQDVLPEFAELRVLEGWDGDNPKMRAPKVKATTRHLATHTSGLEYEFWRGEVAEDLTKTKHPSILAGTKAAMFYPMMTDPEPVGVTGPPWTGWASWCRRSAAGALTPFSSRTCSSLWA